MQLVLTPELIIEAYRHGLFPMAYNSGSPYIQWVCPEMRGQLSITDIHIPKSLKKILYKNLKNTPQIPPHPNPLPEGRGGFSFEIRVNTAFEDVITACAQSHDSRPETWINESIIKVFCELHAQGHAHSIECWENDELVGGLYGLTIGGVFFGESMFSRAPNASKIALIHLCARLWKGGFQMLDTQFVNDHLEQFGVYEIPHDAYIEQLEKALEAQIDFTLKDLGEIAILSEYLEMRDTQ